MLKNTYTTDDLIERLGFMRKYYGTKIFTEGSKVSLEEMFGTECEEHTLRSLKEWEKEFTKSNIQPIVVYEALDTVQEEISGMPTVTMYVPVRFGPTDVERFGTWFRTNVQPSLLISLRVDPRSTGGCSLIWKHTYYDFSLHYYIQRHRDDVVKMVNEKMHA
jgi:hypothetical protein